MYKELEIEIGGLFLRLGGWPRPAVSVLDSLLDRRWRSVLGFPLSVWRGSGAGTVGALAARSLERFSQSIGVYVHFF